VAYGGHLTSAIDRRVAPHALEPGEGMIVRRGFARVALYRDEAGVEHACMAVCTHLGGPVHWNAAERSWDCPCHGARFDPLGRVITGPATKDLEKIHDDEAPLTGATVLSTPTATPVAGPTVDTATASRSLRRS
jgi:nitrite reductase/ring-hydroxylating ferredoxin subunit